MIHIHVHVLLLSVVTLLLSMASGVVWEWNYVKLHQLELEHVPQQPSSELPLATLAVLHVPYTIPIVNTVPMSQHVYERNSNPFFDLCMGRQNYNFLK